MHYLAVLQAYHSVLAVRPDDPLACDLLHEALEAHARAAEAQGGGGDEDAAMAP